MEQNNKGGCTVEPLTLLLIYWASPVVLLLIALAVAVLVVWIQSLKRYDN